MSLFRSLFYDRRIHFAVFLGVVCAAAVLTGALLVGDSMRGSLRALTLDRLGRIDTILQGNGFFEPPNFYFDSPFSSVPSSSPIEKLQGDLPSPWTARVPAILLPAAVEYDGKISDTQILGLDDSFVSVKRNEVMINRALADRLGVKSGETLSLRLHSVQNIPPESSLGRRDDLLIRSRVTVRKIIPNRDLGRFSLKADQQAEPLLLAPLSWLQNRLDVDGKVNTVFFLTDKPETVSTPEQRHELEKRFKPSLSDMGITVEHDGGKTYVKSDRMLFTKAQAGEIQRAFPEAEPGLLYLATSIRAPKNNRETPYSTVYASPKEPETQRSAVSGLPPPITLNRWTAEDLDVEVGDEIELTWFAPENVHETKTQIFRLAGINDVYDSKRVPEVEGLTDEQSIAEWNPPFPFDAKKIRKKDEDYWDKYKAAPKAFVSLETGRKLWAGRFGDTTTFHLDQEKSPGRRSGDLANLPPSLFGLNFIPVKEQGLAASSGTTPFSVLFLSFSFFIIASALMLVMMLFRLSVETKAKRIGIRLSVGWTRGQVARLLLVEGSIISVTGSFVGVLLGILYARLMVYGLTTWWVDAVTVPFLTLHIDSWSLVFGFFAGVVLALSTIVLTLRNVRKIPVKTLLAGDFERPPITAPERAEITAPERAGNTAPERAGITAPERAGNAAQRSFRVPLRQNKTVSAILSILAMVSLFIILAVTGFRSESFFVVGGILLVMGVAQTADRIYREASDNRKPDSLAGLAAANAVRNQSRSLLFIGLVASTTFLVLSIGAFRLETENESSWHQARLRGSGNGGFSYIGETTFPVYHDIATVDGRRELGIQPDDEQHLFRNIGEVEKWISFRMRDGDRASCLNLYQPGKPRILGVPEKIEAFSRFRFAQQSKSEPPGNGPWSALRRPITVDPDGVRRVPVILDANTAMYALHLYGGVGSVYETRTEDDECFRFEIVGLLSNSILQGDILMGEKNFESLFPESGGYRLFLCGYFCGPDRYLKGGQTEILYGLLGDYGFRGEPTSDRLRKLFAVQNTYLSTFQSLGGIGLLLGVFGLAVIQLRNVFERRKELALMRAIGFSKSRVMLLLLYESFSLLFKGLALALLASLLALAPFLLGFAAQPADPVSIAVLFAWLLGGMILVGVISNVAAARSVLKISVAKELAEER